MSFAKKLAISLACGAVGLVPLGAAHAATMYYDKDGATAGFAGNTGNTGQAWNGSFWSTDATGSTAGGAWVDGSQATINTTGAAANLNMSATGTWSVAGLSTLGTKQVQLSGGTFTLTSSAVDTAVNTTFSSATVSGDISKTGAGSLSFSGGSYTGNLTTATGSGNVQFNMVNSVTTNKFTLNAGSLILSADGAHTIAELSGVSGTVVNFGGASNGRTLIIDQATNTTFAGQLGGNTNGAVTGLGSYEKKGIGTLKVGAITADGSVTVTAGALILNGSFNQATNTTAPDATANSLYVNGGTLGGNGTVTLRYSANALFASGTTLAPGDAGVGTFIFNTGNTTGNTQFLSGAKIAIDLDAPGTSDKIQFSNFTTGDLVLNSNVVDLNNVGGLAIGTYTIMEFYQTTVALGVFTDVGKPLTGLVVGSAPGGFSYAFDYSQLGKIDLVVSAIPEPATASVLALSGVALMLLGRRR